MRKEWGLANLGVCSLGAIAFLFVRAFYLDAWLVVPTLFTCLLVIRGHIVAREYAEAESQAKELKEKGEASSSPGR